jgi:hypothetical protein
MRIRMSATKDVQASIMLVKKRHAVHVIYLLEGLVRIPNTNTCTIMQKSFNLDLNKQGAGGRPLQGEAKREISMGHNRCRSAGFPCLLLLLSLLQQRAYAAPVNTISTTNPAATSACDLPSSGDGKTTACFTGCRVCYFISADTDKQDRPCLCCKPGYALNTTDDVAQCDACSVGTYAPTAGCTECTACERGTTTTAKAARVCNGACSVIFCSEQRQLNASWLECMYSLDACIAACTAD